MNYSNSFESSRPNPFEKPNPYSQPISTRPNVKKDKMHNLLSNKIQSLNNRNPFSHSNHFDYQLPLNKAQLNKSSRVNMFPRFDEEKMTIIKQEVRPYINQNKTYAYASYKQKKSYSPLISQKNIFVQKYGNPVSSFLQYSQYRQPSPYLSRYEPLSESGRQLEEYPLYSLKDKEKILSRKDLQSGSTPPSMDRRMTFSNERRGLDVYDEKSIIIKGRPFYPTKVNRRKMEYQ